MDFPVIDAHQHIWNLDKCAYPWLNASLAPIDRTIEFAEAAAELRHAGVDYSVLVQSADDPRDTATMRDAARVFSEVAAVVGYAPLERPAEVAQTLDAWADDSLMVGVRTLIHDQADPDWIVQPAALEGLGLLEAAGKTFDYVAVLPRHLEHIPVITNKFPNLRIVIDHLAKPPIGVGDREPWASLIAQAAESPNVFGKVSGLYAATGDMGEWTADSIRPFFDHAIDVFGIDRLMYGGDWPISVLAGGYQRVWRGLNQVFAGLRVDEREALLGRNATRFYNIDPSRIGK